MSSAPRPLPGGHHVEVERHPITGATAGMLLVLSAVLAAFSNGWVPVSLWWVVVGVPVGAVLGGAAAYTVPPHRSG